jgi:uncharacterized membrane protein
MINNVFFDLWLTVLYMVCCVFQATNLVNNYRPRKSARTFASEQEASNKLYTVLCAFFIFQFYFLLNICIISVPSFRLRFHRVLLFRDCFQSVDK